MRYRTLRHNACRDRIATKRARARAESGRCTLEPTGVISRTGAQPRFGDATDAPRQSES
jgi:hypothetical protein